MLPQPVLPSCNLMCNSIPDKQCCFWLSFVSSTACILAHVLCFQLLPVSPAIPTNFSWHLCCESKLHFCGWPGAHPSPSDIRNKARLAAIHGFAVLSSPWAGMNFKVNSDRGTCFCFVLLCDMLFRPCDTFPPVLTWCQSSLAQPKTVVCCVDK